MCKHREYKHKNAMANVYYVSVCTLHSHLSLTAITIHLMSERQKPQNAFKCALLRYMCVLTARVNRQICKNFFLCFVHLDGDGATTSNALRIQTPMDNKSYCIYVSYVCITHSASITHC